MEIRILDRADDRSAFHSGDADLDRFLTKYAGQNQFRHHIGVTWVAVGGGRIIGYATVAAGTLEAEGLPSSLRRRLPGYPLPALRLARLAVDRGARERGVGRALLRHACRLAAEMAGRFGCVGIVVDAKAGALDFYSRFGFAPLEMVEGEIAARPAATPMFLPLDLVLDAVRQER